MSQRMAQSVAQGMHHMAHQSTLSETNEDLCHIAHLELQERMQNPIAFHAEMMGDILYLQQALRQPDAKEFVQAIIKEVNRHWIARIGPSRREAKFLKMSRLYPLYAPSSEAHLGLFGGKKKSQNKNFDDHITTI
jgi:hypothetical protein